MSCLIVLILDSRSTFLASGSNGSDVHVHDLKHIVDGKVHACIQPSVELYNHIIVQDVLWVETINALKCCNTCIMIYPDL